MFQTTVHFLTPIEVLCTYLRLYHPETGVAPTSKHILYDIDGVCVTMILICKIKQASVKLRMRPVRKVGEIVSVEIIILCLLILKLKFSIFCDGRKKTTVKS